MSILIHDMEMPKLSESITIYSDGRVVRYDTYTGGTIRGKAVEVPPHGRLIDADALVNEYEDLKQRRGKEKMSESMTFEIIIDGVVYDLKNAPTVIEAEVSNE